MTGALLYLQYQSVKNRTVMRIKRLRQPKYLVGFLVGALYLYFYLFRFLFHRQGRGFFFNLSPENRMWLEFAGAAILFVIVAMAWIIPHDRAALTFTEAEIAFLFPAPISRTGLIHFKLLRSQTAIFVTTILLTFVTNRLGGRAWIHAAGWWLILSTLNLHLLGSSFALTRLIDKGLTKWRRRLIILTFATSAAAVVLIWARRTLPHFDVAQDGDLNGLKRYLQQVLVSGPVPYLLFPFRLVVRPYLAPDARAFFLALGPVLLLLVLHYIWVLRSQIAFEEASLAASQRLAEKVAAVRAGNYYTSGKKAKKRRPPFPLRPIGQPAIALLWKSLISAGQVFTLRIWIRVAMVAAIVVIVSGRTGVAFDEAVDGASFRPLLGMAAVMFMVWSLFIGPQLFRQDFRQDLAVADILKTYPMPSWELAAGELLGPLAILTGLQWFLLILALGFFPYARLNATLTVGIGLGAAVLIPTINAITLQIPNAAVLMFPAWFRMGKGGSQGIEVTGQRLIFMLGQFFVFTVALLPAAGVFAMLFLLVKTFTTAALGKSLAISIGIVVGSGAAALVLAAEAALGILLLGSLFEKFDVSAEQPA